jgi:hypothetical protein
LYRKRKNPVNAEGVFSKEIQLEHPSVLTDWSDGDYHNYNVATKMMKDSQKIYTYLSDVFSIGNSVLGKDIWCNKITNENYNEEKSSCLIDGYIHVDACLYLAEYILINFVKNETISYILNTSKIDII